MDENEEVAQELDDKPEGAVEQEQAEVELIEENESAEEAAEETAEEAVEETTEEAAEKADSSDEQSKDEKPKKTKKKRGVGFKILMVVVIIIVVIAGGGGIAYGVFHNNPGFCNFICHVPMDPYVASYQENKSINSAQQNSTALLSVTIHKDSDQKITCLQCHQDGISAQLQEGMAWISGNYSLPLDMKVVYRQPKEGTNERNGEAFCLRAGCHEGISDLATLKKSTADRERNPHDNHNGNLNCYVCHQTHELSVLYCTQCHTDVEIPDGWLTYKEWDDLNRAAKQ